MGERRNPCHFRVRWGGVGWGGVAAPPTSGGWKVATAADLVPPPAAARCSPARYASADAGGASMQHSIAVVVLNCPPTVNMAHSPPAFQKVHNKRGLWQRHACRHPRAARGTCRRRRRRVLAAAAAGTTGLALPAHARPAPCPHAQEEQAGGGQDARWGAQGAGHLCPRQGSCAQEGGTSTGQSHRSEGLTEQRDASFSKQRANSRQLGLLTAPVPRNLRFFTCRSSPLRHAGGHSRRSRRCSAAGGERGCQQPEGWRASGPPARAPSAARVEPQCESALGACRLPGNAMGRAKEVAADPLPRRPRSPLSAGDGAPLGIACRSGQPAGAAAQPGASRSAAWAACGHCTRVLRRARCARGVECEQAVQILKMVGWAAGVAPCFCVPAKNPTP